MDLSIPKDASDASEDVPSKEVTIESFHNQEDSETAALVTTDPLANLKADFESQLESQKADFKSQLDSETAALVTADHFESQLESQKADLLLLSKRRLEEEGRKQLPRDTFSFLVCSKILSQPFFLGISVFIFQITIYSLLTLELINMQNENPLGLPTNVEIIVRVTQFLAIVIAVLTQADLRTSLEQFSEGYSIGEEFEGEATCGKWWFATACWFLEGAFGLAVTFLLIVTVGSIFKLLLNFTAMEFVTQLDNVAFFLAGTGYFGSKNADKSEVIQQTTYLLAPDEKKRRKTIRALSLVVVFSGMFTAWGVIIGQQNSNKYLCKQFFVYSSQTQLIESGLYTLPLSGERNDECVQYIQQNGSDRFGYCNQETAWAYYPDGDHCEHFTARSAETTTFDIRTIISSPWVSDNLEQLNPIRFLCMDAIRDHQTLPSELGNLSGLSECINCVSRLCGSASSSTHNFAAFRCLSFVCLFIHPFLSFLCSVFEFELQLINQNPA
jgi:hypothetical protein